METIRSIVVVDDDRDARETLAAALEFDGFTVREASDGLSLMSSVAAEQPDAIVMDVSMSWISGLDLCRDLKRNEELRGIPVVFVSGRRSPKDVNSGLSAGAVDYFTKPVDIDRLSRRLKELTAVGGLHAV